MFLLTETPRSNGMQDLATLMSSIDQFRESSHRDQWEEVANISNQLEVAFPERTMEIVRFAKEWREMLNASFDCSFFISCKWDAFPAFHSITIINFTFAFHSTTCILDLHITAMSQVGLRNKQQMLWNQMMRKQSLLLLLLLPL